MGTAAVRSENCTSRAIALMKDTVFAPRRFVRQEGVIGVVAGGCVRDSGRQHRMQLELANKDILS